MYLAVSDVFFINFPFTYAGVLLPEKVLSHVGHGLSESLSSESLVYPDSLARDVVAIVL